VNGFIRHSVHRSSTNFENFVLFGSLWYNAAWRVFVKSCMQRGNAANLVNLARIKRASFSLWRKSFNHWICSEDGTLVTG
jgi:hypothetical protein